MRIKGSVYSASNLISMNPESPRFSAVSSLLFSTQRVAVALPAYGVRRRLNLRILIGHRVFDCIEFSDI